jgi:hypothetical protein
MGIVQILDPLIYLLQKLKHLNETYEVGTVEELQKLENQTVELREKGDSRLYDALHTPIRKTKYKYLSNDPFVRGVALYGSMEFIVSATNIKSFFVKNGDKFIAFIIYVEDRDDRTIVKDIRPFSFNADDPYKDTVGLIDVFIDNYKEVNFFADLDNKEVVEVYKKYSKRHNGYEPVISGSNIHFKIPGKAK